jgi:MFS family permease
VTSAARAETRNWWTVGAVAAPLFIVTLGTTVVNAALPAIQADLRIRLTELEWSVAAFLLAGAILLLTGGRVAGLLGRKRTLLLGLVVFTCSSLACGLAESEEILIAARAVQGLGAALILVPTLGLTKSSFAPPARGRAYDVLAGVTLLGLVLGPLAGGVLVDALDWRWVFYVNVPAGVAAFLLASLVLRESSERSVAKQRDFAALARNRLFVGASVTALLLMLALLGGLFVLSIYMQNLLGYTATETGAILLLLTLAIVVFAPVARKLTEMTGERGPITVGMSFLGLGLVLWSPLDQTAGFSSLLPGLIAAGLGLGLAIAPIVTAALGSLSDDRSDAGMGSNVVGAFALTGGALGVAIMGAALVSSAGDGPAGTPGFAAAFVVGFEDAMLLGAFFSFAGAGVAALMIKPTRVAADVDVSEPVEVPPIPTAAAPVASPVPEPVVAVAPAPAPPEPIPTPLVASPVPDAVAAVAPVPAPAAPPAPAPPAAAAAVDAAAIVAAVRDEIAPLQRRSAELRDLCELLLAQSAATRRERIEDLELLTQLIIDGWRAVDRRLGRLEQIVLRIDEAQRKASASRAVIRLDARAEPQRLQQPGPNGDDAASSASADDPSETREAPRP